MRNQPRVISILVLLTVLTVGCGASGSATLDEGGNGSLPDGREALKRVVLATAGEPDPGPLARAQFRVIKPMINSGLSQADPGGTLLPVLAERVPSLENGDWKLFADGRMETTWTVREGARWHDGVPFSADDLVFSLEVGRDPQAAAFNNVGYAEIDQVTALDARTLTITWKQPNIEADTLFGRNGNFLPLPKHLLERTYREDKVNLLELSYWAQDFVGTGPFRVREWITGVGVRLEANDAFVLGRPRIDEIELKQIPDAHTLAANLLVGAVDVTPQVGSIDLGLQLREQWHEGAVVFNLGSGQWQWMIPQFIDPHPLVIGDVRFRRALVLAIDREEMVDTLGGGISPVPHSMLEPNQPEYRAIEASIPRYSYDPRRAAQFLQELGYQRGPDGVYQDAAGRRLEVEVRTGPSEELGKAGAAIAGYWQRLGVAATAERVPAQRMQDFEYLATFPAFFVLGGPTGNARTFHSSRVRLPRNNFRASGWFRYMNAELDGLIDTYYRTIPIPERTHVLGQIARHVADEVVIVGLNYSVTAGAVSKRLLNVSTQWPGFQITWNAHEWDVRS
jgi:peptide/nickel transport system substrate-binding protein